MKVNLRYDRAGLDVELPADHAVHVLRLHPHPALTKPRQAIVASLKNPIGTAPLKRLAEGRESACVLICDITRPVPNCELLTPILETLIDSGISFEKITILVATGLHRGNDYAELREMIGDSILSRYKIINHDARNPAQSCYVGAVDSIVFKTPQPIFLNRFFIESDLKIAVGLIEPHFMAGYSGGRKLVCPGVASAETIMAFHSPPMIAHPQARAGNLVGNPIHEMSVAAARLSQIDFICNVTLSEDREITGVFSGDLEAAHQAGVNHVDMQCKVPVDKADIVITSGAGYPLDTTLYQAVKGIVCALPALKTGGSLILAAGMRAGVGGEEFRRLCESLRSPERFLRDLFQSQPVIDQWQMQKLVIALQQAQIHVVTDGASADFLRKCQLCPAPSVEAALAIALPKHGPNATITVIPEGPYLIPVSGS